MSDVQDFREFREFWESGIAVLEARAWKEDLYSYPKDSSEYRGILDAISRCVRKARSKGMLYGSIMLSLNLEAEDTAYVVKKEVQRSVNQQLPI